MSKKKFILLLSTAFGAGLVPKMPGTIGSLVGLLVCAAIHYAFPPFYFYVVTILAVYGCVLVAHEAEEIYGIPDCQKIVIDEVAGILVTMLFVPFTLINLGLAFVLFRIFDVIKIFPAYWVQKRVPGGWGVVGDDIVAGIQAGIVFQLIFAGRT